jgi:hypothetical protein
LKETVHKPRNWKKKKKMTVVVTLFLEILLLYYGVNKIHQIQKETEAQKPNQLSAAALIFLYLRSA